MERLRQTERLRTAQRDARSAEVALDPAELGSARQTRHSFARSFLRSAAAHRWAVTGELSGLDADGRGEVVYRIDAGGRELRFVAFCTTIAESARTDRVIAEAWDVTAALIEGELTVDRLADLRREVPQQEGGRADPATIIWARANRSARFFDYVVERLAQGLQPEPDVLGDSAYVLRSTAFYSNGKWGLADFDRIGEDHPLAVPYRAQMLCAWLLRELSYELVEHCARDRSAAAVGLEGTWRRYFGLGNATGLGMVPYVINHPKVLDAWVALRELPLATALGRSYPQDDPAIGHIADQLDRAVAYFAERDSLSTAPYPPGPELAASLQQLADQIAEFQTSGIPIGGRGDNRFARSLHDEAAAHGIEVRQVVDTILVECDVGLDDHIEQLLRCDERPMLFVAQTCGELLAHLETAYGWTAEFDFSEPDRSHYFWYCSASSEEPRRGIRGVDGGESVEYPIDIARRVFELVTDLEGISPGVTVAEFLIGHPWHRGTIERIHGLTETTYGEARVNPIDREFLPLDLQRFQLAVYGMENFSPQSTDWLRVTLFSGAPRVADVAAGVDDDWLFNPKPGRH